MGNARRLVALWVLCLALGAVGFGIVRGVSETGPAHGVRIVASIAPPIDDEVRALAEHVARLRVEEKGTETRVVVSGDQLVIELGEQDPEIVRELVALLERTGKLEVHLVAEPALPADRLVVPGRGGRSYVLARETLLAGHAIRRVEVEALGVAIDTVAASQVPAGASIAFVLDDRVVFVGTADRVEPTSLHVRTMDTDEDAAIGAALDLVNVVEAGAAHPIHVIRQDAFSRATGFVPRAWPFGLAGLVLAIVAWLVWPPRRR